MAEALQDWLAKQKRKDLFGGIAIERNNQWYVNSKKTYEWPKAERGDWGDWDNLSLK